MSKLTARLTDGLVGVAVLRREQAPVRAVMAIVAGGAFALGLHLPWLFAWVAGQVLAQGFELWALWPFREGVSRPPRWREAVALVSVAVLALAFDGMAVLLWRLPGSAGAGAATLLLCAGMLNVLALSRGAPGAFFAAAAPHAVVALALPLTWAGGRSEALAAPFMAATAAFIFTAFVVWRDGERTLRREAAALGQAQAGRAAALDAWEARQAFVAQVSHELRTPLTAVLAAASTLEGRVAAADAPTAATISDSARLMRRLLDDLLDLAKLEAGRMTVERVPFGLRAVLREAAELWSAPAKAKALSFELAELSHLPESAVGDPLRLRQVLNNLLSNAVKFTSQGVVRLEAEALRAEDGGWALRIRVSDTGRGVSAEELARLFQPFAQADGSVARTHGGTGLGLAISRELAHLMGGDLEARPSANDAGAVFELTMPLGVADAGSETLPLRALTAWATDEAGARSDLRVLVVDDHLVSRRAVLLLLESAGVSATAATDGAEALERLATEPLDLVLTDVRMPGIDGLELTRRLRAEPGPNRAAAVLGVTGLASDRELAAALAAGMDGCVVKPLEPRAFYAAVEAALQTAAERTAAGAAASVAA